MKRMYSIQMTNMIYRTCLIMLLGLISININAQPDTVKLSADTWEMSRHGEALIKVEELRTIVQLWHARPLWGIELRYPGGEEGELWVIELRDWLISLGVPSSSIHILPGSDAKDVINMSLIEVVRNK